MSAVESFSVTTPTIGVLGRPWRASVSPWGAVVQWDDLGTLDWYVAADDRWHVPSVEPTVRQTAIDGTPVIETRLRIPQGDAVQRVYAVADHGGLTVVEVENDSPMPIAVAFSGVPVLSARPPSEQPPQGIDLPAGSVVFPVGHRATIAVAIRHDGARVGALAPGLPSALQVARGWTTVCERASRLLIPDPGGAAEVIRARCQLMLDGPASWTDDPVMFLLGVSELVRMGSVADEWMPDVAEAVGALTRHRLDGRLAAALDGAERICVAAADGRARRDLLKVRARLAPVSGSSSGAASTGVEFVSDLERSIARDGDLFPEGLPTSWLGANFEVYGVPCGVDSQVSLAVRWHGERPAVLWERTGGRRTLTASMVAPGWSSDAASGEALWPAPPGHVASAHPHGSPEVEPVALPAPGLTDPSPDGDVSFG
ncbi:MAG: hypothetical protein RI958_1717 [Actinomycetota bacterium]|jgi:hypothetical protein